MQQDRERLFPKCLYTSYQTPVHVAHGKDHFYHCPDADHPLLDLYNNVCHIGHSNERVHAAVSEAYQTLNINTRYLNEALTEYASHLSTYLPSTKKYKIVFTNSGSEANDLALQIAMTYAKMVGKRIAALEGSYHGTTWLCQEASHLTPTGRVSGVSSCIDFVSRTEDDSYSTQYASIIVESIQGVGGNFDLSTRFLRNLRSEVKLMICDEVQTGFGRSGRTFWAFEKAGIVPDIITCGKPIANGYPMGACILASEWEPYLPLHYFNTFGGGTAACRVAEAVLKEIEEKEVVRKVGELGDYLKAQLATVDSVEQVTGDGLFLGISFHSDRNGKEIVERLKDEFGILVGIGWGDVVRVKPPTTVERCDLDQLVEALKQI